MSVVCTAGLLFGILGNFATRRRPGRDSVLLIGYVAHIVAFYLIFVSFPADSPLQESEMQPYIVPRFAAQSMLSIQKRYVKPVYFAACCI